MLKIYMIVRRIAEKIYNKANPQYKHIIRTRDAVFDIQNSIHGLERRIANIETSITTNDLEKQYLIDEITTYRYLYLMRYLKGQERFFDFEGKFGTGIRLLDKYTLFDSGICCNSIGYYSRLADMLFGKLSENIKYIQGTIFDADGKYDVITCFNENKNELIDEEYIEFIFKTLENNGIFAFALKAINENRVIESLLEKGFILEKKLYQNSNWPELVEKKGTDPVMIAYLRKKR